MGNPGQSNRARDSLKSQATDISDYLRSLEMRLLWRPFDRLGLPRIVQLINKTNQFNLTTRRYVEDDVLAIMDHPESFGLQLRLIDRFGDNGIIAIVIGKKEASDLWIDTWLMSCRVLGRQVEQATLYLIIDQARRLGAKTLIGEYLPTPKNGMVKTHYVQLGFTTKTEADDGASIAVLDLDIAQPGETFIDIQEG